MGCGDGLVGFFEEEKGKNLTGRECTRKLGVGEGVPGGGAGDGFGKGNQDREAKLVRGAPNRGHVAGGRDAGLRLACKGDMRVSRKASRDGFSKFQYGYIFARPDIVGTGGLAAEKHGPEPDGEIRGVQPGSVRGTIAAHGDRAAAQSVADEVADGEVSIDGKQRMTGSNLGCLE
jgi:hypothetical protein